MYLMPRNCALKNGKKWYILCNVCFATKKDAKLTMTHFQMGANLEELNLGPLHVPLGGVTSLCFLDFE